MSGETEHYPEPWRIVDGLIVAANGDALIVNEDLCWPYEREAFHRAVACVNACAGIPTVALERDRLAQAFDALRRIRALSDDPVARADAASALQTLGLPF